MKMRALFVIATVVLITMGLALEVFAKNKICEEALNGITVAYMNGDKEGYKELLNAYKNLGCGGSPTGSTSSIRPEGGPGTSDGQMTQIQKDMIIYFIETVLSKPDPAFKDTEEGQPTNAEAPPAIEEKTFFDSFRDMLR